MNGNTGKWIKINFKFKKSWIIGKKKKIFIKKLHITLGSGNIQFRFNLESMW